MNPENAIYVMVILCVLALAGVMVIGWGVERMTTPQPSFLSLDPSCTPTYQGDRICVAYVAETDCMCHAYSLGGLSCTPCKDLSPGVCP